MEVARITMFTVATAAGATVVMIVPGLALAWLLARGRFRGHLLLETLVSLPLVMPPVATGLILLILCSPRGPVGRILAMAGIEEVYRRYEAAAATLGAAPLRVFLTITLPLALPSVLAGTMLGFARAIGEFGATIVIAGSIPGATRTLAVAIYSFTETGRDHDAALLLVISAAIAFLALVLANRLTARSDVRA